MAAVLAATKERVDEVADSMIVSGHIAGRALMLQTAGGDTINAGVVLSDFPLYKAYQVGSIFRTTSVANPSVALNGGVWAHVYTLAASTSLGDILIYQWVRNS